MSSAPTARPASPGSPWWRRHRRGLRWATAWVPIVVIAFFLIGFSDIVPVTFSGGGVAFDGLCNGGALCGYIGNVSLPSGPYVTVQWTDLNGTTIAFFVAGPNTTAFGPGVCGGRGPSGACHFVSSGGEYTLHAIKNAADLQPHGPSELVDYTVTYYRSLL
jgi:hypothetical protein